MSLCPVLAPRLAACRFVGPAHNGLSGCQTTGSPLSLIGYRYSIFIQPVLASLVRQALVCLASQSYFLFLVWLGTVVSILPSSMAMGWGLAASAIVWLGGLVIHGLGASDVVLSQCGKQSVIQLWELVAVASSLCCFSTVWQAVPGLKVFFFH